MEIYQLKTFVTVAREGSITRASELLFTSQPAVSAHIKAIEEELGITLFVRTPKGMSLTAAGERLLDKAEQTLAAHRSLLSEAVQIKGIVSGNARVGHIGNASAVALGRFLGLLSEEFPALEITLHRGFSSEVLGRVKDGSLDAGFALLAAPLEDGIKAIWIEDVDLFLAMPPNWETLAPTGDWASLANLPWICPEPTTFCGRASEDLWRKHGIVPPRIVRTDQESVTRTLVAGGVGVGLVHGDAVAAASASSEIRLWRTEPVAKGFLAYVHLKSRSNEPVIDASSQTITRVAAAATSLMNKRHPTKI